MDEARTEQRERHEAYETEIAEHFVDDATCRRGRDPDAAEIIRRESRELIAGNSQGRLRVDERFGDRAADLRGDLIEIVDFSRAVHVPMAREYLLDEGRAGARHANDEDGELGRVPVAGGASEQLLRIC